MKVPVLALALSCLLSAAAPSSAQINVPFLGTDFLKPVMRNGLPNADGDFAPATLDGIILDMDQTQNLTMNGAFRIFGNVSGGQAISIAAIRDDRSIFPGVLNMSSGNYAIVVTAGNFLVRTCYGTPTTATHDDTGVTVTADTMLNVTLSPITTYTVSGTVTDLDPSAFGSIAFASRDGTTGSSNFIFPGVGTYSVNVQSGEYSVSVLQANLASGSFTIFPVGAVTVVDTAVAMNFSVGPNAHLSGNVTSSSSIPPNSSVIATETTLMPPTGFNCVANQVATGISPVDPSGGAYQMTLPTGRNYYLSASFPISPADPPQTATTYQWVDPTPVDFQGETVRDPMVSFPTDMIVIGGQITSTSGDGIADATVAGIFQFSSSGTSAPPTAFVRGTRTDSAGNYRLVVPRDPSFRGTLRVTGPQPNPP